MARLQGLPSLAGASALVTGGASGIGAALCRRLALGGARVLVADLDLDAASRVAEELGGRAVQCDVRDQEASERAVALAEEAFGGLDIAMLNAGVTGGFTSWDDLDVERYLLTSQINVDGVVFGLRAALPALRRRGGGGIVVTSSLAGLAPAPATPIYSLTKHAVVGLVRSMSVGLAAEDIVLGAVCPGFTETPLISATRSKFSEAGYPLLTADEVAAAAVELSVSDRAGACVVLQPGREPMDYGFRRVPGARGVPPGTLPPTRHPVPGT